MTGKRSLRTALWMSVLCAALVAALGALCFPQLGRALHSDSFSVKLYHHGKVVGNWRASGPGRMDGNSYVFHVRKGASLKEIRIYGDFVVEEL